MATNKRSIARRAIPGLVALLMGAPVAAARANAPVTAEQAQVRAMREGVEATHLRKLGGVAYKSGAVQRAEAQQAKYEAMAARLSAPPVWTTPSPVAEHYAEVAQHYREMGGGPAYKWRRVAEAEAQERRFEPIESPPQPASEFGIEIVQPPAPSPDERPMCETESKPVVAPLDCAKQ
jgi:hypothetical protein